MDHSTEPIPGQIDRDRICEDWVRAGLIATADRPHVAALLREVSPETWLRSVSDACAQRILGTPGADTRNGAGMLPVAADEPVRFSLFEEFLDPAELTQLTDYTLAHQDRFRTSQVISHTSNEGRTDHGYRRSRVLFEPGPFQELIADRLRSYMPQILRSLRHAAFAVSAVEAQITASNDGEFFRVHNDNTHTSLVTRELTYVLFFHREPKAFTGGELRLYDSRLQNGRYVAGAACTSIVPQQNMVVFFPSYFMHEVMTVHCPSQAFADSRFTLNGWLHR